ncbi:MAG: hypothetical protein NC548_59595 [Lachnospiraceae bacterium]|nr:hypothetical protein [Lachnospiraceae bacterium]MCM1233875.1 hypothetical protein [Ruminococcus flavefaciens]
MSEFNPTEYKKQFEKNNYDRVVTLVPKGVKQQLQEYCKLQGISVNKLINNYLATLPIDYPDK